MGHTMTRFALTDCRFARSNKCTLRPSSVKATGAKFELGERITTDPMIICKGIGEGIYIEYMRQFGQSKDTYNGRKSMCPHGPIP